MALDLLFATVPEDFHAVAVAEALQLDGHRPVLWYTMDFPSRTGESVEFDDKGARVHFDGPELSLTDCRPDVVWYRRIGFELDADALHPADVAFASEQCAQFRAGMFGALAPDAFWVNPRANAVRAEQKVYQHARAIEAGLAMPPTLYSNDPARIRAFVGEQGGTIAFKPLKAQTWRDQDTRWIPYTAAITAADLVEDDLLRAAPGIYQGLIEKAYELRVTFIGRRQFAAKVLSQQTDVGKLDYRRSYHELRLEPYRLPDAVAERCLALMDALGLVFGCFDFIVTPGGDYVFLEVNQAGQWLFIEAETEQPLLDAFCQMLVQRRADYQWSPGTVRVRLCDVESQINTRVERAMRAHVAAPDPANVETP